MGGDFAPSAPVAGALLALSELDPGHRVQLVGRTSVLREQVDAHLSGEFAALKPHADRLDLIDATDVIDMSDKPSAALRGKPNSSMHVGLKLQVDGKSDAFVSAGNTGAQMAVSTVVLRLHHGVQRPAIATVFPTAREPIVVVDSGANVDCSPVELVQFARLGAAYAEAVFGRANACVGLLSIGEEPEKGNAVVRRRISCSPPRVSTFRAISKVAISRKGRRIAARSMSWCATASSGMWCSSSTKRWRP
jgi:glycerol-3-phosphate acyltransferase PlsX